MGTELGVELDESTGISVGPLLGRLRVDGGTDDGLALGRADGSRIGLLLGLRLTDGTESAELGVDTGISVGPALGS
jgi:hypothetical protein